MSKLFPLHFNTYVIGIRPVGYNFFYSESDFYGRQILTVPEFKGLKVTGWQVGYNLHLVSWANRRGNLKLVDTPALYSSILT